MVNAQGATILLVPPEQENGNKLACQPTTLDSRGTYV
jgi:hypothetical protein